MKSLILHPHEIRQLHRAGRVLVVRPIGIAKSVIHVVVMPDGQLPGILPNGAPICDGPCPKAGWMTLPLQPGEARWVKECWRVGAWGALDDQYYLCVDYRADSYARRDKLAVGRDLFLRLVDDTCDDAAAAGLIPDQYGRFTWDAGQSPARWRSAVHLPRELSRHTVRVVENRVLRVQQLTSDQSRDAGAECPYPVNVYCAKGYKDHFADLWQARYGRKYPWDSNPWVVATLCELEEK